MKQLNRFKKIAVFGAAAAARPTHHYDIVI